MLSLLQALPSAQQYNLAILSAVQVPMGPAEHTATLTQQPGIKEEEGSEHPAIGVASKGGPVVDEGQQTPHEEEGSHNHTAAANNQQKQLQTSSVLAAGAVNVVGYLRSASAARMQSCS